MKTRLLHLTLLSLPLVLISLSVNSQTVAIGHVSAEVVEAVGASSNLSTGFDVDQSLIGSQAGIIDLGSIELNSGVDLSCSLTVSQASLSDAEGNKFSLEAIPNYKGQRDSLRVDGSQTIALEGRPQLASDQASGSYSGALTLVFAYN